MLVESGAYLLSDGLYGRVAARLYRDLRVVMFDGVLRRRLSGERRAALSSRFVSDAESMEDLTVAVLDQGAISVFDLTAALVVLALLDGWLLGVIAGALAVSAVVTSRLRRPAAAAGERRQEALELMSDELSRSGSARPDASRRRFRDVVEAVSASELRLGWIGAANRQGSQALASLGQVVVLLAAFLDGGLAPGTLLSVYLLAGRALGATETLLDARFEIELARGSVARCFALADVV
jgi:ABC-type multidrug transport system fused ATPase/permease subunit